MRETFKAWKPSESSRALIDHINEILKDLGQQGYRLTLRQLYYQLVSRDVIPNSQAEYNRIGNIVSRGRLAGLIDWSMIEDRVRIPQSRSHWNSPKEIIETATRAYYKPRWDDQEYYVEVWCEKDAVSNIIQPVCNTWDVTFMANRGYSSQSAIYEASRRFQIAHFEDKKLILIYLGDHDPSGIDMTRDIRERMELFLEYRELVAEVDIPLDVHRLALNMDQIQRYNPPENPAKMTDSRFKGYVEIYGVSSWELDALAPKVMAGLVEDKILEYLDMDLWNAVVEAEESDKERLMEIAKEWGDDDEDTG